MIALSLLLCLVAVSQQLSITKFEVPDVVKAGENADLTCKYQLNAGESESDVFVKWWWKSLESSDERAQLYQRLGAEKNATFIRHNLGTTDSIHTIKLVNVSAADSGVYECEVSSSIDEVRRHQDLIVYSEGSGPQLNVSEVEDGPDEDEEQDVLIECVANDVAPEPDFILTINGQDTGLTVNVEGPDEEGLYDIDGNVTLSRDQVDGADIRCELVYINPNITHQPYVDSQQYDPTGALTTTEAPENSTGTEATPDSLQHPSDHGTNIKLSWILLLTVGLLSSTL